MRNVVACNTNEYHAYVATVIDGCIFVEGYIESCLCVCQVIIVYDAGVFIQGRLSLTFGFHQKQGSWQFSSSTVFIQHKFAQYNAMCKIRVYEVNYC